MAAQGLDPESLRFQAEVEALVGRWAGGDERERWRRWKQLGSWSISRTQGDVVKKWALKKALVGASGGRCMDCGQPFATPALQMHRLDRRHAHDRARNFGYFVENVVLVCAGCHQVREDRR